MDLPTPEQSRHFQSKHFSYYTTHTTSFDVNEYSKPFELFCQFIKEDADIKKDLLATL